MHVAAGLLVLLTTSALPAFTPYTAKADRFSIDFPGSPKVEKEKQKDKKSKITSRSYTVDVDDGLYTVVVLSDPEFANYSDEDLQHELDGFRDVEKENGKITAERKLTVGAFPGLELSVKGKEMDSIARMIVTKSASYTVVVDIDHGKSAKDLDADRFFASFALLDDKGAVVAKAGAGATPPAAATTTGTSGTTPPPAKPASNDTDPASVHDFMVTAVGSAPKKYGIAMKWLADVKSDAADASIEVKAQCWMPDGKTHKLKKAVAVPKGSAGKSVDLELKLVGMPAEAKKCTLNFNWLAGGKTVNLDMECWPGEGDLYGGPCDGGA